MDDTKLIDQILLELDEWLDHEESESEQHDREKRINDYYKGYGI